MGTVANMPANGSDLAASRMLTWISESTYERITTQPYPQGYRRVTLYPCKHTHIYTHSPIYTDYLQGRAN